jgi:predicted nucleic acid-binding protein
VVDAGVAIRMLLSEQAAGLADRFTLVAPPLMWSEAASALRSAVYRKELNHEVATEAIRRLADVEIQRSIPGSLYLEAWTIAEQLGWAKTYDAEYIALAKILSCRVITRDARLKRGADGLVPIVGPDDL